MKETLFKKEFVGKIILAGGLLFGGAATADYKVQNNLLEKALQDKFPSIEYACSATASRAGGSCGLEIIQNPPNPLTPDQRKQMLIEANSYKQLLIDQNWGQARYVIDTLGSSFVLIGSLLSIPFFYGYELAENYQGVSNRIKIILNRKSLKGGDE